MALNGHTPTPHAARQPVPREGLFRTILIADDEESICTLLEAMLKEEGYQTARAGCGREALLALDNRPTDLLIADIKLPDMDGVTLMKRAFERHPHLAAITMTGYGTVDVAVEAMKAGAADFLVKPFQRDAVTATVKRLADVRRLRREHSVLKHQWVRTGTIRVQQPALADFGNGGRVQDADGLTEYERGVIEGERRAAHRDGIARERERTVAAALVHRLEEQWKQLHRTVEQEVTALAFSIACKVLRQTGESNRDMVLEQVRAALAHVTDGGVIEITVHPLDLSVVESVRDSLLAGGDRATSATCYADPSMSPGGCMIRTKSRLIDATLETQLRRLGEAIR
ncbi:MAG TPA: response regulator [Nitrospira sp.]|nr:response regulator [Nitrospira sp.]